MVYLIARGAKWSVVTQAFRLQRYEEKLVLYQLFHKILGIIPIFRVKT